MWQSQAISNTKSEPCETTYLLKRVIKGSENTTQKRQQKT